MIPLADIDPVQFTKVFAPAIGGRVSGLYYQATPSLGTSTSSSHGVGVLRVGSCWIGRQVKLAKIGAEVTAAGDAGSTVRIGIYADNGNGYPGALVADCGTIPGDAVAVAEITVNLTLNPGLYWVGMCVQGVTTTQPTVRTASTLHPINPPAPLGTSAPAGTSVETSGFAAVTVTGALPATFPASVNLSSVLGRVFYKVA